MTIDNSRRDGVASRTLRLALTALALGGIASSFALPAWSERLRAEGYYGYADLALQATTPHAYADSPVTLQLAVDNFGPEVASNGAVVVRAYDGVQLLASADCTNFAFDVLHCVLAPTLAVNARQALDVNARMPADTFGTYTIGAFAVADQRDPNPGNELVVQTGLVTTVHELAVDVLNRDPEFLPDGSPRWTVRVVNLGPSTARATVIYMAIFNGNGTPGKVIMHADPGVHCSPRCDIPAGAGVTYIATAAPMGGANGLVLLQADVSGGGGVDPGQYPNAAYIGYRDYIHASGFE